MLLEVMDDYQGQTSGGTGGIILPEVKNKQKFSLRKKKMMAEIPMLQELIDQKLLDNRIKRDNFSGLAAMK